MIARHQIAADVELANVEFLIPRHAPMALPRAMTGQNDQFEAIRFYRSLFQRANDFVVTDRNGKSDFCCHARLPEMIGILE